MGSSANAVSQFEIGQHPDDEKELASLAPSGSQFEIGQAPVPHKEESQFVVGRQPSEFETKLEKLAPQSAYHAYLQKEHPEAFERMNQPDELPIMVPTQMGTFHLPTWNQIRKSLSAPGTLFGPPSLDEWRKNELMKTPEGIELAASGVMEQLKEHPIRAAFGFGDSPQEGLVPSKPPIALEQAFQPEGQFGKGLLQGASSMLSPSNLAMLMTLPADQIMGLYYTGQMGKGTVDQLIEAKKAYDEGDKDKATNILGQASVSAAMTGVGAYFTRGGEIASGKLEPKVELSEGENKLALQMLNDWMKKAAKDGNHQDLKDGAEALMELYRPKGQEAIDRAAISASAIPRGEFPAGQLDFQSGVTGGSINVPKEGFTAEALKAKADAHEAGINVGDLSDLGQKKAAEAAARLQEHIEEVEKRAWSTVQQAETDIHPRQAEPAERPTGPTVPEVLQSNQAPKPGEENLRDDQRATGGAGRTEADAGLGTEQEGERGQAAERRQQDNVVRIYGGPEDTGEYSMGDMTGWRYTGEEYNLNAEGEKPDMMREIGSTVEGIPTTTWVKESQLTPEQQAHFAGAEELNSKINELQAILPKFEEEIGGVRGVVKEEASREGAAQPSGPPEGKAEPPPVISREIDRELADGGIHVVGRGEDMWWTGRFLGGLAESARLLNQQGHPLGPILTKIAGMESDVAKSMARVQGEVIKDWNTNAKRLVSDKEWEGPVVDLLNNPEVTPTNRPSGIPDNIWKAYEATRRILDVRRIAERDALRKRLILSGVDPAKAQEWVPDDYGITKGYYPHSFPGDYTITRLAEIDEKGNEHYEPITTGWRAESKWAAQKKAEEWLASHPGEQIKIDRDTFSLPGKDVSDRSKLFDLSRAIKEADSQVAGGATPEDVLKSLYDESAAAAFGPKRIAPRQFGHAMERESDLPGWARDMDNFERYLYGSVRFEHLAPAREALIKLRNGIAELSGMPSIQRPSDIPSSLSYQSARQFGNILARVDSSIEGLEGRPGFSDAFFRKTLGDLGFDPNIANRVQRPIQMVAALMKLGFNPARVLSHGLQVIWAVRPVLGELATLDGVANAFNPKYDWLLKDLAVSHGTSSNDIEGFRSYMADYFGRGTNPIDWTKGTAALLKDVGMMPFAAGINFTRRTAAIGAYIKGIERDGLSKEAARDYARDVMDRTAGEYSPADNAVFTRQLPGTVAQFKNFMLKTTQFIYGLRTPGEISRFMTGVAVLGFAGMPFLRAMSNLIYNVTGEDVEGDIKRRFPHASRGVFGAANVDIPAGVGLADLSIGRDNVPMAGLLGPAASDAIAVGTGLAKKAINPYSRESSQSLEDALRNLSPTGRRLWDEAVRITGGKPSLVDPHTDSVILHDLSTKERAESLAGLTPLRVAQERETHAYIRHEIDQQKDKKGYFVDKLAGLSINSSNQELSEEDRHQAQSDILRYLKVIHDEYPELGRGLAKSVKDRMRTMQQERLERDIRKAPRNLRGDFYIDYQALKDQEK